MDLQTVLTVPKVRSSTRNGEGLRNFGTSGKNFIMKKMNKGLKWKYEGQSGRMEDRNFRIWRHF